MAAEISLIAELSPEYNSTRGGEGIVGWVPSAETRALWSRQRKERGFIITPEHRAKMIEGQIRSKEKNGDNYRDKLAINKKISAALKGRQLLSAEAIEKIAKKLTGRKRGPMPPNVFEAIMVAQNKRKRSVQTACGLCFESTAEASRVTKVRQGNIVNNCSGRSHSAGGYVWRYVEVLDGGNHD